MDIVIYAGIAINIIGALLIIVYATKYQMSLKEVGNLSEKRKDLRYRWMKKKTIGLGIMIGGTIIAIIGCLI